MAEGWWVDFYDALFAEVCGSDDEGMDEAARFVQRACGLVPSDRVLDQCCGAGRLSLALGRLGLQPVGVDQSREAVAHARRRAERSAIDAEFFVDDARRFVPGRPVDAAVSWATSCGYTDEDEETVELLAAAVRALRPGGCLIVDHHNGERLRRDFAPRLIQERGTVTVERTSRLSASGRMLEQRWLFRLGDDTTHERHGAVRLFGGEELLGLLGRAGLGDLALYGDVDGSAWSIDSRRCIAVGRRRGP